MKKIILSFICFLASMLSIKAQTLYNITYNGGNDGVGTIIKFTPATNNLTVVKSFENPGKWPQYTNLIQASNGKLYGMTANGGYDGIAGIGYGGGSIFSFDPSTSTYTKLKNFNGPDGANPCGSLVQASNGKLYGMTRIGGSGYDPFNTYGNGVIFSFDPVSSTYTKLKDFDGTNGYGPYGSLMQTSNGKLYGMTTGGGSGGLGVIFSFDPLTSTYTKLKDFNVTDGYNPSGSLMQASNGKLYGMTTYGGSNDGGVIFSFDPSSSTYTKLKDFDAVSGVLPYGNLTQASNGKLYGMTSNGGSNNGGVIFSFDLLSSTYTKLKDFDGTNPNPTKPYGSLIQTSDGKLYGMTSGGGSTGYGVIFSFDPSSSTYTKLKDLDRANGGSPSGSLMQASNGKLYGLTTRGGAGGGNSGGFGVIFSFDPSSSTYTKLRDFEELNGRYPSNLFQASDGKFYGTTSIMNALSGNDAFIFSFDPSSSFYTKLMHFDSTNTGSPYAPYGSFIQASDGKLYGMTGFGGSGGYGVIFSFDPLTSTYTKLKDFDGTNGRNPYGSLLQASNGKLYGMTASGGSNNYGVIFSFDLSSSTYTKLVDFDNTNGANPWGNLMQASNGKLYGMTANGGSNGVGVIFSFDLSTSTYTKLIDFGSTNANGSNPYNSLIQASDGKLYGMAGVIFSFNPSTSTYTMLKDFPFINGAYPDGVIPLGNLMQASNGKLYGMTAKGGNNDAGVVFSFDPSASTYTKLKDFDSALGAIAYRYFIHSAFIEVTGDVTGVNDITNSLHEINVFPNPASGIANISFFLDRPEKVSVKIFDITGRQVKGLVEKIFPQGENQVQWNTSGIQAGMYFLKIDAGVYSNTKKIWVIK